MTARTPGSPMGAPQDDAQPTEAHGDGGDAGRAPATRCECSSCREPDWQDIEEDTGLAYEWKISNLTAQRNAAQEGRSNALRELEAEHLALFRACERVLAITAERDRARATAVTLEQELARYRAMVRSLAPRGTGLLPRDGAE